MDSIVLVDLGVAVFLVPLPFVCLFRFLHLGWQFSCTPAFCLFVVTESCIGGATTPQMDAI